jgi:hypothetical protein
MEGMRQTILAALLAAVAASALTLLLSTGMRPPAGAATTADFRAALADLVGEVAALRREMAGGRGAAPAPVFAASPGTVPAVAVGTSPPAAAAEETPAVEAAAVPAAEPEVMEVRREERSAIPRTQEVVERLRTLTNWEESAEIRKAWILAGEEQVVNAFGKPDEVWVQDGGAETWNYRTLTGTIDENGDPEWQDITLSMNRGRLVRVDD